MCSIAFSIEQSKKIIILFSISFVVSFGVHMTVSYIFPFLSNHILRGLAMIILHPYSPSMFVALAFFFLIFVVCIRFN